jgi:hypothetical protein
MEMGMAPINREEQVMSHELKELTSQEIELVAGGTGETPAQQAKTGGYVKGLEDFTPEKFTLWTFLGFR